MEATTQTAWQEASRAFNIVLERLYAMARQRGTSLADPSDLEATLIGLPSANRSQVMLVLESVESRAVARDDEDLAEAARAIRETAGQVWAGAGASRHS